MTVAGLQRRLCVAQHNRVGVVYKLVSVATGLALRRPWQRPRNAAGFDSFPQSGWGALVCFAGIAAFRATALKTLWLRHIWPGVIGG